LGRVASFDYRAVERMLVKDPKLINYACEHGVSKNDRYAWISPTIVVTPLMSFFINRGWIAFGYLEYPDKDKIIKSRKRTIKLLRLLLKKGADCNTSSIQKTDEDISQECYNNNIPCCPEYTINLFLFFSNYIFLNYETADRCLQMLQRRDWKIDHEREIHPVSHIQTKVWLNEEQMFSTKLGKSIPRYSQIVINNYLRMQKKLLSYRIKNKQCDPLEKCKVRKVLQDCCEDIFREITSYL